MGDGQLAFQVVDLDRLTVAHGHTAGGAVAHMTHGDFSLGEAFQLPVGEDLIDKANSMVGGEKAIVIDYNAAAFLTPVL